MSFNRTRLVPMAQAYSIDEPLTRSLGTLFSCRASAKMTAAGTRDKGLRKRMLAQRCALVSNTDEGGAVSSDRLVTSYTLTRSLQTSDPELYDPFTEAQYYWTTKGNIEYLTTLQCSTDGLSITVSLLSRKPRDYVSCLTSALSQYARDETYHQY
jgi:hypothetical protein